jgi:predicted nucleic acid-binding protein
MGEPMTRPPSATIAIDANILVSAVLGLKTGAILARVSSQFDVICGAYVMSEARRVLAQVIPGDRSASARLDRYLAGMDVVAGADFENLIPMAESTLRNAPASRNGSSKDAHVLALAWMYDADIWSHDRDYAGTGWPSWSSANLAATLAPVEA